MVSATSSSITLEFDKVENNGGSPVTNYVLYVDHGTETAHDFKSIDSYNGVALEWTVTMLEET